MSPPAMLRQMYRKAGNQESLSKETGIGVRLARRIMNEPGCQTSATTRALIKQNFDRLVPFPMPVEFRLIREELTEAKANPGSPKLEKVLRNDVKLAAPCGHSFDSGAGDFTLRM